MIFQTSKNTQQTRLQDLVRLKNNGQTHIKDEKKGMVPILDVIVQTHQSLLEATEKYNLERDEISYRYPGGQDVIMRKYMAFRPPSIEQVEKELGLDGELTEIKKKIYKKYSYATDGEEVLVPTRQRAAEQVDQGARTPEAPKRAKIRLEK
jgi:hypothetical protein